MKRFLQLAMILVAFVFSTLTVSAQSEEMQITTMPAENRMLRTVNSTSEVNWGEWYEYLDINISSPNSWSYNELFGALPTEGKLMRRDSDNSEVSQLMLQKFFGDYDCVWDYNPITEAISLIEISTNLKFPGYEDFDDVRIYMNKNTFSPKRTNTFTLWFLVIGDSGYSCQITFTSPNMPDGKIDAIFSVDGVNATKATFKINELGKDVAKIKYAILPRYSLYKDDLALLDSVNPGVEVTTLDIAEATNYTVDIPLTKSGAWYLMMQVYDKEDDVLKYYTSKVYTALDEPEKWKSLGKGRFTDGELQYRASNFAYNNYFPGFIMPDWTEPKTWEVEVQESVETPGLYRVVNPYTCETCPYTDAVMEHKYDRGDSILGHYRSKYVFDHTPGNDFYLIIHTEEEGNEWAVPTYTGYAFLENDAIENGDFRSRYQLFSNISGVSTSNYTSSEANSPGLYNDNGVLTSADAYSKFKLILPGAKAYTFSLSSDNNGNWTVSKFGYDVKKVVYAVAESSKMNVEQLREAVKAGTIECATIDVTEDTMALDLSKFNLKVLEHHIICAYSADEEGNLQKVLSEGFFHDNFTMQYAGKGTMTDVFFTQLLSTSVKTLEVEIYTTPADPSIVFVKDFVKDFYNYPSTDFKYMGVRIESPTRVSIIDNLYGYGNSQTAYYFTTFSEYLRINGYTDDEIEASGGFGTYSDNVVSIPADACIIHYMPDDAYYYVNETFTLVLPEGTITGIEDAVIGSNDNAPVEYYDLFGRKINNPSKGIYIKKQGNKATKVSVR